MSVMPRSWLAAICGLALAHGAIAEEAARTVPGVVQARPEAGGWRYDPKAVAKAREELARNIDEYSSPVAATEPSAEQKAKVQKLIGEFGSGDFKVRESAVAAASAQGAAALGQLRAALADKDAEVSDRAKRAVAAIETAARQALLVQMKGPWHNDWQWEVLSEKRAALRQALAAASADAAKAEASGDADRAAKLRLQAAELTARAEALERIKEQCTQPSSPQG